MGADIKPGDLVAVIYPQICCGNPASVGKIGKCVPFPLHALWLECSGCGSINLDLSKFRNIGGIAHHIDTLKKIDPPALAEDTDVHRELEAI